MTRRAIQFTTFALLLLWSAAPALSQPLEKEHLSVEFIALQKAAVPGTAIDAGLHFKLEDHWHIYWKNPGDSGRPTRMEWDLPEGVEASRFNWPAPERQRLAGLMNYGYSHEVLLPLKINVPKSYTDNELPIAGTAKWLVCREECIPGEARLSLTLPVASQTATNPETQARFAAAQARMPTQWPAGAAYFESAGDRLTLTLENATDFGLRGATLHFVPEADLVISNAAPQTVEWNEDDATVRIEKNELLMELPEVLRGVVLAHSPRSSHAFAVSAQPAAAAPAPPESGGLFQALLFALLGGILLNLMPCVFPVLSIKILGFVNQSGEDRSVVRCHGFAYAAGVIVSFWALAGALLALRAGGEQLGWGFQLQSPPFLIGVTFVLFLLALSLSGVVEFGASLTGLGNLGSRMGGYGGSFLTGVLATVVATPCTAPFMGAALGYALTMPSAHALAVFSALGAGMALPYVALSEWPGALRALPRPGAWMETFRQAMAFPLYATVIWLVSVLADQRGADASIDLLIGLLAAALGLWIWSKVRARKGRPPVKLAGGAALIVLCAWGGALALASARVGAPSSAAVADDFWKPYSKTRVTELTGSGTPVFVNFTAAWCITCKANEKLVFSSERLREAFGDAGVATLKADWTNRDDEIARTLESHGRSGVPLYVLHPAEPGAAPRLLPPVLSVQRVIEEIEGLQLPGY